MQKMVSMWRLVFPTLVAALFLGSTGNSSLARGAFDEEFTDCPAWIRLDAVDGLTVAFTNEADEIRISWNAPGLPALRKKLGLVGTNPY